MRNWIYKFVFTFGSLFVFTLGIMANGNSNITNTSETINSSQYKKTTMNIGKWVEKGGDWVFTYRLILGDNNKLYLHGRRKQSNEIYNFLGTSYHNRRKYNEIYKSSEDCLTEFDTQGKENITIFEEAVVFSINEEGDILSLITPESDADDMNILRIYDKNGKIRENKKIKKAYSKNGTWPEKLLIINNELIDNKGNVVDTDQKRYKIKKGKSINNIHKSYKDINISYENGILTLMNFNKFGYKKEKYQIALNEALNRVKFISFDNNNNIYLIGLKYKKFISVIYIISPEGLLINKIINEKDFEKNDDSNKYVVDSNGNIFGIESDEENIKLIKLERI